MPKLNMKGATPLGATSLCSTCSYGQAMRGYRESEQVTLCTNTHPAFAVPFAIAECSEYYDKNRPSYDQMQKLAIHVEPRKTLKPVGFRVGFGVVADSPEEEDANDDCADEF